MRSSEDGRNSAAGACDDAEVRPQSADEGTPLAVPALEAVQRAVFAIARELPSTCDLRQLLKSVQETLLGIMPADDLVLWFPDVTTAELTRVAIADDNSEPPVLDPTRRSLVAQVIASGRTLRADPRHHDAVGDEGTEGERHGSTADGGSRRLRWLGAPLRNHLGVQGAVVTQCHRADEGYREGDEEILSFVADQLSMAIDLERRGQELERLAYFDPLTGLENRRMLGERAAQSLARAARRKLPMALLCLDIDRFKNINEALGYAGGDELLRQIAAALADYARRSDSLARLGGDEFAILLEEVHPREAGRAAKRLLESLDRPFEVHGKRLYVAASIGVALYPDHGESLAELLEHADMAMYRVKRSGGGIGIYDAATSNRLMGQLETEAELRAAVDAGQLALAFQPFYDLASARIVGVEALVRWPTAEGQRPAADFIPLAEESELIRRIDRFTFARALRDAVQLLPFAKKLQIAINVSARTLYAADLVDEIGRVLAESGVPPEQVILEVTESAAIRDPGRTAEILQALRTLGLRLAVDDFGSGYASLTYLRLLPFDRLKIDRSMVAEVGRSGRGERLLEGAIALARGLEMEVTAEGIESTEQLEWLRGRGCERGQGYFLGRPRPLTAVIAALERQGATG